MPFTTRTPSFSMGGPAWLALIVLVWWAALLNPSQAEPFSSGIFDGVGLPDSVIATDRQPSLETDNRRRTDLARDGSSPAALAPAATVDLSLEPIQWLGASVYRLIARPTHSLAQPRAPPANT